MTAILRITIAILMLAFMLSSVAFVIWLSIAREMPLLALISGVFIGCAIANLLQSDAGNSDKKEEK